MTPDLMAAEASDQEHLTATKDPTPALRAALMAAATKRRRRARLRGAAAAGICAVVGAAALTSVLSTGPSQALAIERADDWVEVQIVDSEAGAGEMTRELREAGIQADVRLVPVNPEAVGEWTSIHRVDADDPPTLLETGELSYHDGVLRIHRDAVSKLDDARWLFEVGREPHEGEALAPFSPSDLGLNAEPPANEE